MFVPMLSSALCFIFNLPPYGSYSSLLRHALELRKPVLHLNVGPTRADGLPGVDKLEIPTSAVMTDVVNAVM